ncbi:MAG: ankyrin repeat domain-containing protein [Bacteroidales bacterium]
MQRLGLIFILIFVSIHIFGQSEKNDSLDYALMDAAWEGDIDSVVYLLKAGADVNAKNDYSSETPLIYAAQQGNTDIVKILLHNGADPEIIPRNDEPAMIRATALGYMDVVEEIIRYGGDVNQRGKNNRTALHYASTYGHYFLVDMLLYYGALPDARARYDVTPLMNAINAGQPSVAELLIRKGAKANLSNSEGYTPLMLAAQNGMDTLSLILINNGADVSKTNIHNETALSLAVVYDHMATADSLIQHGANVNHQINNKNTILTLAQRYSSQAMVDLLKKHGATQNMTPNFDLILLSYSINMNTDDALFGTHFGYHEIKSNINISMGFSLRYFAKRVLTEQKPDLFHQYWERRYLMPLNIDKLFNLSKTQQNKWALMAGIKTYYTWGRYRGVNDKPDDDFGIAPRIGIYWRPGPIGGISLNYEYMDLHQNTVSPHRINLSFLLHFDRKSSKRLERQTAF